MGGDEETPITSPEQLEINPWRKVLEDKRVPLEISPNLLEEVETPDWQRNPHTGLATEANTALRREIVDNLSACIREGRPFGVLSSDVDNLKYGNDNIAHQFGDMVIVYGTAAIGKAIDSAKLSPNVNIVATASSQSSDETIVWLFDINIEEAERLRQQLKEAERPIEILDPRFRFSITTAMIHSSDPLIQEDLSRTEKFLTEQIPIGRPKRVAFDLRNKLRETVDGTVKSRKFDRDLERMPEDTTMIAHLRSYREMLITRYGNSRISAPLLERMLKVTEVIERMSFLEKIAVLPGGIELIQKLQIDMEDLRRARTVGEYLALHDKLFEE